MRKRVPQPAPRSGVQFCTMLPARGPARAHARRQGERGQALVELMLVVPVVLLLAVGTVGAGRVVQSKMGVVAVAREAARAAALADTAPEAVARGSERARDVAAGYRLDNGSLAVAVDPGDLGRGGRVRAEARYELTLDDLPLLAWVRVPVAGAHDERTDLHRSRWGAAGQP